MENFLEYIEEDTKSKKTLFSTMPVNTKTNRRKFNKKIDSVKETYQTYKDQVEKYLTVKSKSFDILDTRNTEAIQNEINDLENIKVLLNPINTYFEKMNFDDLFYQISNYKDFNFVSLNKIISEFINKFELVNIRLTKDDFDYTFYVNEFMTSFLETRSLKSKNYDHITEIFEKIYWENPDLIFHIELNFRKLIKKHERKFINYIKGLQDEKTKLFNYNYQTVINKLKDLYTKLEDEGKENITDIINLSKNGTIDVNHFFEDSKVRNTAYTSLMLDSLNIENEKALSKFYDSLEKLKINVEEYSNYVKYAPLILDFKKKYLSKKLEDINKNELSKKLKELESSISKEERNLNKINKKIMRSKGKVFRPKESELKALKFESLKIAKKLYEMYQNLTKEYFNSKVYEVLNNSFSINDFLNLYYSFDYYKKEAIKESYDIETHNQLMEYSDDFDIFAMNPNNVIVCSVMSFDEVSISKVIMNKYRLLNININEENLYPENVPELIERINLVLRIKALEESKLDVEKLWFMVQVDKLIIKPNEEKD
ncbi:MAG TPA: hypothetical protein GX713_05255 [Mollicutes bacterium]|nr:hypothetical protein [Mollicutes bacterium]